MAAATPLAPDEAYYWVWSRVLQPGYLDHPPMVALWIRFGTLIAGPTPLGVRLLGPLAAALGSLLLYRAGADFFPRQPGVGFVAAGFLNASLLFGVGSVIMTPDTPLLFFWTLGLFAIARLLATGNGRWWLAMGLAVGLALASKYTAFLFIAAVGVWLLCTAPGRQWLRRPEPWLALALALLVFAPVVAWNAAHGWVSFLKQGGRLGAWQPVDALRFEAELVLGQAALLTPLIFAFAVWGTWRLLVAAWHGDHPAAAFLSVLTLLPGAVFVEHALGDRVQGNWPVVLYPSAALAAATLAGRGWVRLRVPAAMLGLAMTALVYLQAIAAPFPLSARSDPTLRQLGGWSGFAASVEGAARESDAKFIAAENYGEAAKLAFLLRTPIPVVAVAPRWAYFRLRPAGPLISGRVGLLVQPRERGPVSGSHEWRVLGPPQLVARAHTGRTAEEYLLYRVRAQDLAVGAILPRPPLERTPGP